MFTLEEVVLAKNVTGSSSSSMVSHDSNGSHDISYHSSSNHNTIGGKRNQNFNNKGKKHQWNNGGRKGGEGGIGSGGNAGGDAQQRRWWAAANRLASSEQCSMFWRTIVGLDGTLGSLGYTYLSMSFKFMVHAQLWTTAESAPWYNKAQTPSRLHNNYNYYRHWSRNTYFLYHSFVCGLVHSHRCHFSHNICTR